MVEALPQAPSPENQQNKEVLARIGDELALIYHSVKSFIAEQRMEFSGSRMEKMDHKTALYDDLGVLATTGTRTESPTASGEPALPRTFAERFMDRRLHKRNFKKIKADTYVYQAEKIFGPRDQLAGPSKWERRGKKLALHNRYKRGAILASEYHGAKLKVKASPLALGRESHKKVAENKLKTDKSFNRTKKQPVLTRWRRSRRAASIADIKRHHYRVEKHRAAIAEIRNQ